jgi:hypothetical protein
MQDVPLVSELRELASMKPARGGAGKWSFSFPKRCHLPGFNEAGAL